MSPAGPLAAQPPTGWALRRRLLRSGGPVLAAVLGLGLTGLSLHLIRQQPTAAAPDLGNPAAASSRLTVPAPVHAGAVRRPTRPAPIPSAVPTPTQLALPRQHVQAAVLPVGVTPSRGLDLPPNPDTVGWWAGGAAPGQTAGSAVLAGHLDAAGYGAGALAALLRVGVGDPVLIRDTAGHVLRYQVTARMAYPKAALPGSVFRSNGPATLTLVTCGGPFDSSTHHYRDNIVVSAAPTAG